MYLFYLRQQTVWLLLAVFAQSTLGQNTPPDLGDMRGMLSRLAGVAKEQAGRDTHLQNLKTNKVLGVMQGRE